MIPQKAEFTNPRFWIQLAGLLGMLLVAFGVLSPNTISALNDPLARFIEAVFVIIGSYTVFLNAWRNDPNRLTAPKPPPSDNDQPVLFN